MDEILKIEQVSKKFGGLCVINNLSLSVINGEYLAIIGPNGAGKTTLMRLITGELKPDSGKIFLSGEDITNIPSYKRIQKGLGRSFQITRIFYDLSVMENVLVAFQVYYPFNYHLFRRKNYYNELTLKAEKLLKRVELYDKKDKYAGRLSYGEQRKLEIILALASNPKVLLLDEPTAGLSLNEIHEFTKMINELGKNTTVIFTAHDMNVVFSLAKRVIVLYYGEIIAHGEPKEIQNNQKVKEIYLGIKRDMPYVAVS